MSLLYVCDLCGKQSETFPYEELAHLHVVVIHSAIDNYADHVRQVFSQQQVTTRKTRMTCLPSELHSTVDQPYAFLMQTVLPQTSSRRVIYQKLSEMLALVACRFAAHPEHLEKARESLELLLDSLKFSSELQDFQQLLAKRESYRFCVLKLLRDYGYGEEHVMMALQSDEDEILRLRSSRRTTADEPTIYHTSSLHTRSRRPQALSAMSVI
ncbi:hypothetical protein NM688_g3418 [Phlebia brevispora]|uniref:Uncharacterized protein n=1 Tax=Phlebia brevispora TaxID=194682 RepID=A0ACC1T5M7_9APHY|nr:hypothetical protein NM688_g3418 [Phlebia brevispora]